MDTNEGKRRRRRRHSPEFKADAVAACTRPGVSIASVALAHGVNANLLRRWVAVVEGDAVQPEPERPAAFVQNNNWVENQIRPIALGRNNWLFAGSLRAGKRAAAVMSLVHSARLNGLDPYGYIRGVLERLPTHSAGRIKELLPHCAAATWYNAEAR